MYIDLGPHQPCPLALQVNDSLLLGFFTLTRCARTLALFPFLGFSVPCVMFMVWKVGSTTWAPVWENTWVGLCLCLDPRVQTVILTVEWISNRAQAWSEEHNPNTQFSYLLRHACLVEFLLKDVLLLKNPKSRCRRRCIFQDLKNRFGCTFLVKFWTQGGTLP